MIYVNQIRREYLIGMTDEERANHVRANDLRTFWLPWNTTRSLADDPRWKPYAIILGRRRTRFQFSPPPRDE